MTLISSRVPAMACVTGALACAAAGAVGSAAPINNATNSLFMVNLSFSAVEALKCRNDMDAQ
jgi:hypothetical protein